MQPCGVQPKLIQSTCVALFTRWNVHCIHHLQNTLAKVNLKNNILHIKKLQTFMQETSNVPWNGTSLAHLVICAMNVHMSRGWSMTAALRCLIPITKRPNKQSEQRQRGGASDKVPRCELCRSIWEWFARSDLKRCWQRIYCPHGCFFSGGN